MRRVLGVACFGAAGCLVWVSAMLVTAIVQEYGAGAVDVFAALVLIGLPAAGAAGLAWSGWGLLRPRRRQPVDAKETR